VRSVATERESRTWHHGLVARWWAEFNVGGPEIDFFRPFVGAGQPALDLACGTGRLLLPYLRAGLDVEGCDVSEDMLARCREQAEREGLTPTLHAQALHELDLERRYRTILLCGGFGLGGGREHDAEALRRIHAHLEPGGLLVLDNEPPYKSTRWWAAWTDEGRAELPRPWREYGERRRAADGDELALVTRLVALDPLEQHASVQIRAGLWRDGELVAEEEHDLEITMYFTHEVALLLERAGFVNVEMRAGYENRAPSADDGFVVFLARR
jgi:SAM-dependent methyltransferase